MRRRALATRLLRNRLDVEPVLRDQAPRERRHAEIVRPLCRAEPLGRGPHLFVRRHIRRGLRRGRRGGGAAADGRDDLSHLRDGARRHADLVEAAVDDRLHFDRHLVGFHFEQIVAGLDLVADRFHPSEDFSLGDRLAELRHDHCRRHRPIRSERGAPCRRCAPRSAAQGLRGGRRREAEYAAW